MYLCAICNDPVGPRKAANRHCVLRQNRTIERELLCCGICFPLLQQGATVADVIQSRRQEKLKQKANEYLASLGKAAKFV